MKSQQRIVHSQDSEVNIKLNFIPDLFILFISPQFDRPQRVIDQINSQYPEAIISGCSTAGEIFNTSVLDNSVIINAIKFEKSKVRHDHIQLDDYHCSRKAGETLAKKLLGPDLKHVLIMADGLNTNGAELVEGLNNILPETVTVSGGLAGDGQDFQRTFTIDRKGIYSNRVVGIGLYGKHLVVGFNSKGGWDTFGVERLITKSEKNVLFELDKKPALSLYKSFLGDQADKLPGSGLLFPLSLRINDEEIPVVRTILKINEEEQSLTFAGNIPQGAYARLMKANIDRLIDGAENSAIGSLSMMEVQPQFTMLVSCVGRRLVLKQLVEEEIEVVRNIIGVNPIISGFYSYGEIAPFSEFHKCQLHNQTMTITTLAELN